MNDFTQMIIGIAIGLVLIVQSVMLHNQSTILAASRATGVQCNKYHAYGEKIDKLKTYEETYNDS